MAFQKVVTPVFNSPVEPFWLLPCTPEEGSPRDAASPETSSSLQWQNFLSPPPTPSGSSIELSEAEEWRIFASPPPPEDIESAPEPTIDYRGFVSPPPATPERTEATEADWKDFLSPIRGTSSPNHGPEVTTPPATGTPSFEYNEMDWKTFRSPMADEAPSLLPDEGMGANGDSSLPASPAPSDPPSTALALRWGNTSVSDPHGTPSLPPLEMGGLILHDISSADNVTIDLETDGTESSPGAKGAVPAAADTALVEQDEEIKGDKGSLFFGSDGADSRVLAPERGVKQVAPICIDFSPPLEFKTPPPKPSWLAEDIPNDLGREILPPRGRSVLELGKFPLIHSSLCSAACCQPAPKFSELPTTDGPAALELLGRLPCPHPGRIQKCKELLTSDRSVTSFQVSHPSVPVARFPLWVLTFWESLGSIWQPIQSWRKAISVLEKVNDTATLELLSTIPWDYNFPLAGFDTHHLASLATQEWLTDDHINLFAWMFNNQLKGSSGFFVGPQIPNQIRAGYRQMKEGGVRADPKWITRYFDDMKSGTIKKLGCCLNVRAGAGTPLRTGRGNHWVGLIIDIERKELLYGDSLGYSLHDGDLEMITWWLEPVLPKTIKVRPLQCSRQPGNWSCADYAANMVAHHLAPNDIPLVGSTVQDAVQHRLGLLRRAIDTVRTMVGCEAFAISSLGRGSSESSDKSYHTYHTAT